MSDLDSLSDAAEAAGEAYGIEVTEAANAAADFELAYWKAYDADVLSKSDTARRAGAEVSALEEKAEKLRTQGKEKAAKAYMDVVLARMSAEQTRIRFQGKQDGGSW